MSVCTFSCNDGFYMEGQESLVCEATGRWSNQGIIPKCQRKPYFSSMKNDMSLLIQ